ncbi:hypothetical protein JHK82_035172 [Glycine max]|nr:hypothetical protein JHK85_035893 [Glycine max]KAG5111903.1 hypothetical protein JHK82_035172 [Glycine max]
MKSLGNLDLSLSGFMGLILHQLGNLSNLQHLNLGYNYALQIDNLNWISKLSSLEYLDLSGSNLHKQGNWLQVVNALPSLSELHLESCLIDNLGPPKEKPTSHISKSFIFLNLSNNTFTCPIPSPFTNLSSLRTLNLAHIQLNGTIPKRFEFLKNLQVLNLGANSLTGDMPDYLVEPLDPFEQTVLQHSVRSINPIVDELPEAMQKQSALET